MRLFMHVLMTAHPYVGMLLCDAAMMMIEVVAGLSVLARSASERIRRSRTECPVAISERAS